MLTIIHSILAQMTPRRVLNALWGGPPGLASRPAAGVHARLFRARRAGLETRCTVESPPNLAVLLQAGLKPRAG